MIESLVNIFCAALFPAKKNPLSGKLSRKKGVGKLELSPIKVAVRIICKFYLWEVVRVPAGVPAKRSFFYLC